MPRRRTTTVSTFDRRIAATADLLRAAETINILFDRADALRAALARCAAVNTPSHRLLETVGSTRTAVSMRQQRSCGASDPTSRRST
jgi:hypothetical protein